MAFLDLPAEIRLSIYDLVFGNSNTVLSAKRRGDDRYSLLPAETTALHETHRSAQLLRVCKAIFLEALPILYSNTTFHIIAQAFAGQLPLTFTNGHPAASQVRQLVWQLDCDMMKHYYPDELRLSPTALVQLTSLELRCRAETWRNSFLGEWCDREAFVKGREQTIEFAKTIRSLMASGEDDCVALVEDRGQLERGQVILRLARGKPREVRETVS
jgi:hypothetical protein